MGSLSYIQDLGTSNQEKHIVFAEWSRLSHIISSLPKSPACGEVYASPFYRCGNGGSGY